MLHESMQQLLFLLFSCGVKQQHTYNNLVALEHTRAVILWQLTVADQLPSEDTAEELHDLTLPDTPRE